MTQTKEWVLRKRGLFYRPNARGYTSSIHEAGRYAEAEAKERVELVSGVTMHLASEFEQKAQMPVVPLTDEVVKYIARYGGFCRDCADEFGVCPQSGLPCGGKEKAIRHVLRAYNYGVENGFLGG